MKIHHCSIPATNPERVATVLAEILGEPVRVASVPGGDFAPQVAEAPALDGSLDGFDTSEPLELDHEDQYRRSEEPYGGPD